MALDLQKQPQQNHVGGGEARHSNPLSGGGGGGSSSGCVSSSGLSGLRRAIPVTLDLFHSKLTSPQIELDKPSPLPVGWQKFLDLKVTYLIFFPDHFLLLSLNGKSPKLDLKLNLSPPRANPLVESPNRSASTSPPSSCVSSELNPEETIRYSNSPEATSMLLAGCPRCLMYVMLSEEDPKCPKCKSTVLLDFLHDKNTEKTRKS
ncbi:hypothetical protein HHK36_011448 [Tetracentron sinense]|uniref:GIR1-like zinc ribbon domain-containing protein n=1 Tax=Tetracentron sinense TaxID=13715 RepID=A0A834ZBU5_TETSI|nr:hypothetical protein HHK36_011448 [Tetracentron sinense]